MKKAKIKGTRERRGTQPMRAVCDFAAMGVPRRRITTTRKAVSKMAPNGDRLDDAARAGWLYYVAGNTQDQIATKLGVSRQSAQRLVSRAVSEGLVKVRIDHPIGRCMDLSARLKERFGLAFCDVVPTDPTAGPPTSSASPRRPPLRSSAGCAGPSLP